MSTPNELHRLLSYLHLFQPCEGVLVVGSGSGSLVPLLKELNPSEVLLVEADEKLVNRMKSAYAIVPSWHVSQSIVYKDTQECEYYYTNQSATNGIVLPSSLYAAWSNLKELSVAVCESVSLATLEYEYELSQINWLILECYGAKQIIEANVSKLESYAVVVAKTLKSEQESLDALMKEMNYRSMYAVAEGNPQVLLVVYVKEYAHILEKTTQTLQTKLSETETKNRETHEAKELLTQQLQTLQTQSQESKKSLEAKIEEINGYFLKRKQQALDGEETIKKLQAEQAKCKKALAEEQTNYQKQIDELKKIIEECEIKIDKNKEFQKDVYEYKRVKNYFIKPTYVSRTEYTHYDDQPEEDKWQLEVYLHALGLMKKHDLKSVVDLGCGSGYKLMKYLSDYHTIGLELGVNLEFLKEKYPEKTWLESNFEIDHQIKTDVLICSDVIEHIVDPDQLIRYIQKISFKYLILSTPDRELVYKEGMSFLDGPPRNPAHVREWNFAEFNDYISQYFEIIDHRVTNLQQSTQMIICKQRL